MVKLLQLLILAALVSQATYALPFMPSGGADLIIVASEMDPVPVEPGGDLLLKVVVENYGQSKAGNVTIKITLPDAMLTLKNPGDAVWYLPSLCELCRVTQTYSLHVDSRAPSGAYRVEINASSRDGFIVSRTVNVTVVGKPQLAVSDVRTEPSVVTPDGEVRVGFSVSNMGTGVASAISARMLLDGLPFVPQGTDSVAIERLEPGSSVRLDYGLLVKRDGVPTSYSIPLKLSYQDEEGAAFSSEVVLGLKVAEYSKLSVANVKTDPVRVREGEPFTLTVTIENSGQGDAKSVKAVIDLPFTGTKTAFLGKIGPDENSLAVFNIQAAAGGTRAYDAVIEYEDGLGNHTVTQRLELAVYRRDGYDVAQVSFVAVGAAVAAFAGYTLMRRRNRKSE